MHHTLFAPRNNPPVNKTECRQTYYTPKDGGQETTMIVKAYIRFVECHKGRRVLYLGGREAEGCKVLHDVMEKIMLTDAKALQGVSLSVPWTFATEDDYTIIMTVPDGVPVENYNFLDPNQPEHSDGLFAEGMLVDCVFHLHITGKKVKRFGRRIASYGYAYKWLLEASRVVKYPAFERSLCPRLPPRLLVFKEEGGFRQLHDMLDDTGN
ncbi:hypothetical protein HMN09_01130100 [Mycena chlorophos]|uniref:Uncharacterized protein n=1 Tax=Mycena chlorophos TaxID=658473 RepID=A0A8H6SBE5_MYCCL|nr:hypothetical protein HMN09_01130100 [Mycena chlorophos]